jgi:enterochelin esterase-like enzyme
VLRHRPLDDGCPTAAPCRIDRRAWLRRPGLDRRALARRLTRCLLALVIAVLVAPPMVSAASTCAQLHGQVLTATFTSAIAGKAVPYRIYLPPCYASSDRRYPYLILLHGWPGDAGTWTRDLHVDAALDAGINAGTLAPMVVVMPDGGNTETSGTVTPGDSFESEVLNELMPAVQHRWCVQSSRAGRALGGLSRGGWWALEIGFRHPTVFSTVGGHSPYLFVKSPWPAFDVAQLARSVPLPPVGSLRLWLDAGTTDYVRPGVEQLVAILRARGVRFSYHVYPGDHEDAYWAQNAPAYLAFYGAAWPKSPAKLPACES